MVLPALDNVKRLTTARFFWLCVQAMFRLARLQSSTQNGDGESSLSIHG